MIQKVLVANRGEIAIRAFRAAYELGLNSVAVYPHEDRNSLHRQKAMEAYEIGEEGHPVRAYLDVAGVIEVAKRAGADAIYPGYGFLSENPDLAQMCAENDIIFIGPPAQVLNLAGNKVRAVEAARAAGIPVLRATGASTDVQELLAQAEDIGFPLFVKATAGGGGRGLRRVATAAELPEALETAMHEGESAFGDAHVFLEQAVLRPRHIEVQVLADTHGNVVHLYERDCSVQRRHQKVVEIAPAQGLDPELRQRLCDDAVAFAKAIGYVNAGTVEFLVDERGEHVFIEMNPRIQVEHTVTEEVTGVDLVQAQFQIAGGASLPELGLTQDAITVSGAALQCRVTTEDPANDFRPDIGRISAYRSAGGAGVRLDGGTIFAGAEVLPHFDSMLVKLTSRARTWEGAVTRARRALAEFRIRGVATNLPFLRAVLDNPDFAAGGVTTAFIEEHPELLTSGVSADRGTKMLRYLAEVTVNQPNGPAPTLLNPAVKLPKVDPKAELPAGSRDLLLEVGPAEFARRLREQQALAVTDTTFRDAHQSLLATRVRSKDLLEAAPSVAHSMPQLLSLEAWGGATYDVALRFLHEDPWQRLAALREAAPNLNLQMLLRGRNAVGYTPYPDIVCERFVVEAAETGIDIFRIFDALNDIEQMRPAIRAVVEQTNAIAEGALCYTSDLHHPEEKVYTLDYYLRIAEQLVEAGSHILCIKDMAGLLKAPAAHTLVTALRERFDLPVHLHTHDTAGGQLGTYQAAIEAGVDAVDAAVASMSGTTSQPSLSALIAMTDHTPHATGISLAAANAQEPYWEQVRQVYRPFESGIPAPTGRVYRHEIPGGQLSNLRQQAIAVGLGDRFEQIEEYYAAANDILGNLVKVTPSSKVVGDLALQLAAKKADPAEFEAHPEKFDVPDSVLRFLAGELGTPAGGWPEPFRSQALAGREPDLAQPELAAEDQAILEQGTTDDASRKEVRRTLNRLLFPAPTREFEETVAQYGDLSVIPSIPFFYGVTPDTEVTVTLEKGVKLIYGIEAVGAPDERGMRSVIGIQNGQMRPLLVRDQSITTDVPTAERANPDDPNHIAAPFTGGVTMRVAEGDEVEAGAVVATIEAMKMEANITSPRAGTVQRVVFSGSASVEAGDLLAVLTS